jgi:long-subunit acyl-CoA synthetase (AMP-forming)
MCKSLKNIIYTRNYVEEDAPPITKVEGCDLKILSFNDVITLGNDDQHKAMPFTPPAPEHLALIMYTSGSTGKPKVYR